MMKETRDVEKVHRPHGKKPVDHSPFPRIAAATWITSRISFTSWTRRMWAPFITAMATEAAVPKTLSRGGRPVNVPMNPLREGPNTIGLPRTSSGPAPGGDRGCLQTLHESIRVDQISFPVDPCGVAKSILAGKAPGIIRRKAFVVGPDLHVAGTPRR
jgi:hypothetical protein